MSEPERPRDAHAAFQAMLGPLAALSGGGYMRYKERFLVKDDAGRWDRVRWHQVGYQHLAYYEDSEGCWRLVPGREAEFQRLVEEER